MKMFISDEKSISIVSACLAGLNCRYDGGSKLCEAVVKLIRDGKALPVCPEQLGGLPTPRLPAEIVEGRVLRQDGADLTEAFEKGARESLKLAKIVGSKKAVLKARSPSCGCGIIYDGTFSGKTVSGNGIFADLCLQNGIKVLTEEDL